MFVEFFEAIVIACNANVLLLCLIAKVDACNRLDTELLRHAYTIEYGGSIIDIGKRKGGISIAAHLLQQRFNRECAVAKTVVSMAIEEHGFKDCRWLE